MTTALCQRSTGRGPRGAFGHGRRPQLNLLAFSRREAVLVVPVGARRGGGQCAKDSHAFAFCNFVFFAILCFCHPPEGVSTPSAHMAPNGIEKQKKWHGGDRNPFWNDRINKKNVYKQTVDSWIRLFPLRNPLDFHIIEQRWWGGVGVGWGRAAHTKCFELPVSKTSF